MDDNKILELFWQRSEQAVVETERKFGSMCRSIAKNLLRNDEDAQECLSDTWHAMWQRIPPERPEKLGAYAAAITRNLSMKRLTQRNASKRAFLTVSFEELDQCIPAWDTPQSHLEGKELTRMLEKFLQTLDPESRNMFLRRYWFFDSIRDIARRFGATEGKVRTRLYRIRMELKEYLAREADIYVG